MRKKFNLTLRDILSLRRNNIEGGFLERNSFKSIGKTLKLKLPEPNITGSLDTAIRSRTSTRRWRREPLSLQEISNILFYSCGITRKNLNIKENKRAQASAGALYPINVYVCNFVEGEMGVYVYYYNVNEHSLEVVQEIDISREAIISELYVYDWAKHAPCGVMLTANPDKVLEKYKEKGYGYMYLEAGGIAHMMNIISDAQDIGCVFMGGVVEENVEVLLCSENKREPLLLSLLFGKKTPPEL